MLRGNNNAVTNPLCLVIYAPSLIWRLHMNSRLNKLLPIFGALLLAGAGNAYAQSAPSCARVSEPEIAALFTRWNASLKTLDSDKVTANYSSKAVLLPTVSNMPRTNPAEIRDYFVKFLKSEPQGVIDKSIIKIGCNTASDVGIYTFTMKDGQKVQARYSYVYSYENGKWLIDHHHSSAMPEKN